MQLFCFIHLEKLKQRFNGIYYRGNYLLRRLVPFEHVEKKKPILTGLFLLVPRSFAQINLAKTLEQKNQSFHFGFSSSVPLTVPFSNSFYENIREIYHLRDLLANKGILDSSFSTLIKSSGRHDSLIHLGN